MGGAAQPDVPFEPTCVVSLPIHVFTIELMPGSGTINRESVREIFFFYFFFFLLLFSKETLFCCSIYGNGTLNGLSLVILLP